MEVNRFRLPKVCFMSIRCLQDSAPGFVADKTFQCWKSFFARHPHFSAGAQRLARSKFQGHAAAGSSPSYRYTYIYIYIYTYLQPEINEARGYFRNQI